MQLIKYFELTRFTIMSHNSFLLRKSPGNKSFRSSWFKFSRVLPPELISIKAYPNSFSWDTLVLIHCDIRMVKAQQFSYNLEFSPLHICQNVFFSLYLVYHFKSTKLYISPISPNIEVMALPPPPTDYCVHWNLQCYLNWSRTSNNLH